MNEIEVLRREYAAIPEPDSRAVEHALSRLRPSQELRARPTSRRSRLLVAVALVVAATTVVTLERPFGHGGTETAKADAAAAGFRALSAGTGVWHYRSQSSLYEGSQLTERDVTEGWSTARKLTWFSHSVTERTPMSGSSWVEEVTDGRCGTIMWDGPRPGVVRHITQRVVAEPNPVADYRRAYLSGTLISQTATEYHGMPAYRLVFELGERRQTWTIRRSDYVPLKLSGIDRGIGPIPRSYTMTYTLFELLPASAAALAHLRPHAHPGARVLRYGGKPRPGCRRFGW